MAVIIWDSVDLIDQGVNKEDQQSQEWQEWQVCQELEME